MKFTTVLILLSSTLLGCTAPQHRAAVTDDQADRVTVGVVQREISMGMDAAEVASVLGSPNIVSTSENRQETWIYDKISSDATYSRSSGAIVGIIFGGSAAGGATGSVGSGATSTSQRTLTVIIKFDDYQRVRDFSYHTSRF